MDMRKMIRLVEAAEMVQEIEIGGEVDGSHLDDLRTHDFKSRQHDLFPDIPTLEPHLPAGFQQVGRIGAYFIARKQDAVSANGRDENSYILFDKGHPLGYVSVIDKDALFGGGYRVENPPISGDGLRVVSVMIDRSHAGQNLAVRMYEWLLRNVCDYILPDDLHTEGGVAIWRGLLKDRKTFEVMVYDSKRGTVRRRKPGRDFGQVYRTDALRPFVTLAGKAGELTDD